MGECRNRNRRIKIEKRNVGNKMIPPIAVWRYQRCEECGEIKRDRRAVPAVANDNVSRRKRNRSLKFSAQHVVSVIGQYRGRISTNQTDREEGARRSPRAEREIGKANNTNNAMSCSSLITCLKAFAPAKLK